MKAKGTERIGTLVSAKKGRLLCVLLLLLALVCVFALSASAVNSLPHEEKISLEIYYAETKSYTYSIPSAAKIQYSMSKGGYTYWYYPDLQIEIKDSSNRTFVQGDLSEGSGDFGKTFPAGTYTFSFTCPNKSSSTVTPTPKYEIHLMFLDASQPAVTPTTVTTTLLSKTNEKIGQNQAISDTIDMPADGEAAIRISGDAVVVKVMDSKSTSSSTYLYDSITPFLGEKKISLKKGRYSVLFRNTGSLTATVSVKVDASFRANDALKFVAPSTLRLPTNWKYRDLLITYNGISVGSSDKNLTFDTEDSAVASIYGYSYMELETWSKAGKTKVFAFYEDAAAVLNVETVTPKLSGTVLTAKPGPMMAGEQLRYDFTLEAGGYLKTTWSNFNYVPFAIYHNGVCVAAGNGHESYLPHRFEKGKYQLELSNPTSSLAGTGELTLTEYVDEALPAGSLQIDKTTVSLPAKTSLTLHATLKMSNVSDPFVWTSSNTKVATVDKNGTVNTLDYGKAVITVACGELTAACTVNVIKPVRTGMKILSIVKSAKTDKKDVYSFTMPVRGDLHIKVTEKADSGLSSFNINLKNSKGASVYENRYYYSYYNYKTDNKSNEYTEFQTYLEAGTYTLEIVGLEKKYYQLDVTQDIYDSYPVKTLKLNKTSTSLAIGNSETLTRSYTPAYATNAKGTWKSANTAIAKVDQNGKVTGVSKGTTTITVSCGSVSASCKVTVKAVPITKIWIDIKGDECILRYSPEDTTDKIDPTWTSSNKTVATIDKDYFDEEVAELTPRRLGVTTITVKNGKLKATKKYYVTEDTKEYGLFLGEKLNLTNRVKTVSGYEDAKWSCTGNAKVSQAGNVKMLSGGKATVTATIQGKKYNMHVYANVLAVGEKFKTTNPEWGGGTYYYTFDNIDVASLYEKDTWYIIAHSLGKTSYTIEKDGYKETRKLTVNELKKAINVTYGASKSFVGYIENVPNYEKATWKSSNTSIATVNKNGAVKAVKSGKADIIATVDGVAYKMHVNAVMPKLNYKGYQFNVGDTGYLKLSGVKASAVKWSSADPSVVTVNASGKITAKSPGISKVTARYAGKKFECKIDVNEKGYGYLVGTVTWRYRYDNVQADTGARILVRDTYDHSRVIARGTADGAGNYRIRVPVGTYSVVVIDSGRDYVDYTLKSLKKNDEVRFDVDFFSYSMSYRSFQARDAKN